MEQKKIAPDKGEHKGACNRTACQAPESAYYYNHSTQKHYCADCAKLINMMNPESYRIYGHELCTISS